MEEIANSPISHLNSRWYTFLSLIWQIYTNKICKWFVVQLSCIFSEITSVSRQERFAFFHSFRAYFLPGNVPSTGSSAVNTTKPGADRLGWTPRQ
jgi:hypothetical protein